MSAPHAEGWTRRRFLGGLPVAGAAGLLGLYPRPVAAEPPPETTTLRVDQWPAICFAPKYVAEALLRGEGFTDVHYVKTDTAVALEKALASGDTYFSLQPVGVVAPWLDTGAPIVMLAGLHTPGEDRVRLNAWKRPSRLPRQHAGLCWLGPSEGYPFGHAGAGRVHAAPG
jgi:NitT/TauT family transport system substrate-binding protein